MTAFFVMVFLITVVTLIPDLIDQIPLRYEQRNCQGIYWRRKYPDVPKDEIKRFLEILMESFLFREQHLCKLKPDDKIMDIYNTIYPDKFFSMNGMELADFAIIYEGEYKIDFQKIWHENLTLGELFEAAVRQKQTS